jgi:hypothetical protein
MATKSDQYIVKLTGPGLSFERPVTEDVANSIMNLVMTGVATAPSGSSANPAPPDVNAGHGAAMTPKQFMGQKRPGSNYEGVACLAYYLTHSRNTPHFKTADIGKLATEAARPLSNTSLFVRHATSTYRYLAPAGGGAKQITTLGEAVVEALPDREKVKAAVAEYGVRRKRSRTARKSK